MKLYQIALLAESIIIYLMKFPSLTKFLVLIDIPLLLKGLIIIGILLILIAYPINSSLTKILSNNLGLKEITNQQLVFKSNFEPNISTDNISPQTSKPEVALGCIFVSSKSLFFSNTNDILAVINKNISLNIIGGYDDLVYLRDFGIDTNEFTRLRLEPAKKLKQLVNAAKQELIPIFISSGYRTYDDQSGTLEYWEALAGKVTASRYAAKPGHSEHHLGTTVDILTYENGLKLLPSYEHTKLRKWLKDNAHIYGFVESYPNYATSITGYTYEPWHYRYVGEKIALKIKRENILLQDYLYQLHGYCLVE